MVFMLIVVGVVVYEMFFKIVEKIIMVIFLVGVIMIILLCVSFIG